jgi:hypothetical protein
MFDPRAARKFFRSGRASVLKTARPKSGARGGAKGNSAAALVFMPHLF